MKFDGILICTDLDGTLYRNDKTVSRENGEAIEYFKANGGLFTFITGRLPYYLRDAYEKARPNVPFGCINGGGVYDGERGEYVWHLEMPKEVFELVDAIDREFSEVGIQVCCLDKTYFSKENEFMAKFRKVTGLPNRVRHYREVDEPIGKILFGTDIEEELLGVERTLRAHPLAERFDFIRSEKTLFEILPKGVHKGLALSKLVEHLGVDSRRTVAIGDYDNDVGMFKTARLGVAVKNASAAAIAAADYVTVSNEEHAIARVIYEIEKGIITL